MSLAQVLSTYLTLNLLIGFSYICLRLRWTVSQKSASASAELKAHYAIIALVFVIASFQPMYPRSEVFQPAAKVWSAQSMKTFAHDYKGATAGGYIAVPTAKGNYNVHADGVSMTLLVIALLVSLAGLYRVARDIRSLQRIRGCSYLIRKIKSVNVFLNDEIQVPFSSWLPGSADVVLPSRLLASHADFKIAVAHELQHHRQGDTKWVYVTWAIKVVCAANPLAHLWCRWISELQEFACDETLVDHKRVESQAYARCLVEVAETANNQKYIPACATGLVFLSERNLLKRRIDRMFTIRTNTKLGSIGLAFCISVVAMMAGIAYAANGVVQDRRVSLEDAKRLAEVAQRNTEFPVVVNDEVLKQLNRFIGTPEGREFMRSSLGRMKNYQALIKDLIAKHNVPEELLAVPIAESGYRNLPQGEQYMKAAGLWQFIPSTARKFGLKVNEYKDERLDVPRSTDAAIRYLLANRLRFKDWQLSLMAYNMGENRVQEAIYETGSRDAWTLIRKGHEGDKEYLAKVIASVIIMKNPETVQ